MGKIIPFEHHMAAHCESGTVTALLNHAGMKLTEPMVFGLAGGIFFGYLSTRSFNFPTIIVRSKPGQIRTKIAKSIGVKFKEKKFSNQELGIKMLDQNIESGIPTAAQVDFFYMDYMPDWQRVHINVHFITVIGHDNEKYTVSDSYYPKIAELNRESMRKARWAGGSFAPKGFMYYPVYVPAEVDLTKPIYKGIKHACNNMLKLPIPFIGIKGIYKFSTKINEWPKLARDTEHLSHEVMKINVLLEDQGTGGAGFRYMYASFLQQASQITQDNTLKEMSERMMAIGDGWRSISYFAAKIGKNRDLGPDRFKELSMMIKERGDLEKEFFTDLLQLVKKKG